MATAEQIAFVRRNINEPNDSNGYTDEVIGTLIDTLGNEGTIAGIWEEKASKVSTSVDVTEAGASHKFSDVYKNYMALAKYWRDKIAEIEGEADPAGRVKVRKIVRS